MHMPSTDTASTDTGSVADAAYTGALLIAEPRELLAVTGPDRLSWLDGLLTQAVKGLSAGQAAWSLALDKTGKIQAEIWVLAGADTAWLAVPAGVAAPLAEQLERMLIMEDAELALAPELSVLRVHGAASAALLADARVDPALLAGAELDVTGLGGALLLVHTSERDALVERLLATNPAMVRGDAADWTRLRLERGVPEPLVDFDQHHNPHQAALDRLTVGWGKGCYLGQEVVCMQDMRGKVKRRLAPLRLEGTAVPSAGTPVFFGEKAVGELTSVARSGAVGVVAMARLDAPAFEPGTALSVDGRAATVVLRPRER